MKPSIVKTLFLVLTIGLFPDTWAQQAYKDQFAHTFSIVARDKNTGDMAVGVQSHWFSVGTSVAWGKSGVGVVATQSFINPAYGPQGLKLMEEGKSAGEALRILVANDEGKDFRQVGFLDAYGNAASHTGKNCVQSAGHYIGDNFAVQANMMLNDGVVPAMVEAFESNGHLPLAERVVQVLLAAQKAGGDIRGRQSAALLVVNAKPVEHIWQDKKVDLRVDDSPTPVAELERLLKVHRAYEHMNKGDLAIEANDMDTALREYGAAEKMFPENLEMKYWTAIALANNQRLDEALPIFKTVFSKDPNWKTLTKRLPKSGLLTVSEGDLKKILSL
ncbi:DUF1028 domain-containing protein [Pseudozobellia thermophila]|uniref:Uncharacterized conserved protein, Ntn-hydrolase superfamily n=1 Tax=Pseudozobellia thermophila TaxID=192903 RepID=A0A1M6FLN2_9FLAO|nr:DUF1028 domain-containing protein [Pseudozobellia thermophila]SHI98563.1 Uncharacterized conserved protein, Ntn-hydrolase superfamily [Pseudozobellia thermophila]